MANKHQYLTYYINLTDKAVVSALQFTGSPETIGAVLAAPDAIAIERSAPKLLKTQAFVAPSCTSEWFGTEDHFPTNVPTFDRKSGGWFGIPLLFGETITYHWRGIWTYVAPPSPPGVPAIINIAARRWVDGFELPDPVTGFAGPEGGLSASNNDNNAQSRGASRSIEGFGWAWRSNTLIRTHDLAESGGTPQQISWERFYFRLRNVPGASTRVWTARQQFGLDGWALEIMPTGQISIGFDNSVGTFTPVGSTVALPVDVWKKIDVRFWFGTVSAGGTQFEIWINSVVALAGNLAGTLGPGQPGLLHGSSRMGNAQANTLALDIDDWICAAHQGAPDGVDFQNGSHVVQVQATGFDASMVGFTGDWRWALINPIADGDASLLASSTSGAVLAVTTDAANSVDAYPNSLGAVAGFVQTKVATGGTVADTLAMTGGLATSGPVSVTAADWKRRFQTISGSTPTPIRPVAPMLLKYTKTSAAAQTFRRLSATVELIGTFGPEDIGPAGLPAIALPANTGPHNAPYPRTPWARLTVAPIQPVFVRSGSYVGNGVGLDLAFPNPIHFLFIRNVTAGGGAGVWWFSSMLGAHKGLANAIESNQMTQALWDSAFVPAGLDLQQTQYLLRIAGSSSQSNTNGSTYQYLAIGDPGQRFMMNGCLKNTVVNAVVLTALQNPTWNPLAGFFRGELPQGVSNVAYFKGPGHLPASLSAMDSVELTNALTFSLGFISTQNALHSVVNTPMMPFSLWRTDDGSSDAIGSNRGKVVQISSYIGNGAASRSLNLTPPSGKRPLFAMVTPHNALSRIRDVAHTTNTSSQVDNGTINATGITGGDIDTIVVDVALNTNGIVYEVFAIPGDTVAGNGGFSVAGDFWPVPPDPPANALGQVGGPTPGSPPTDIVVPPAPIPDPAPPVAMPGLTDDLDPACSPVTHRIVNLALSRIGVSKQIVNLATDATAEGAAARLVYVDAIEQTLRDFAWPFATRYVQLAGVSVTRPNSDWLYSYRQPADCLFERRIVDRLRTDVGNPEPIPFALSSDDTGGLIFCNLAGAVLEYTARPKCPLTRSEPLFRDAAAWRLGMSLAPVLKRMPDAELACAKAYAVALQEAELVLRPGNAGEMPAAATIDITAGAAAANVSVINLALVRIGAATIRDLATDQTRSAQLSRMVFERELRAVLRDFPWAFATTYVTPALVAGTAAVPVNADWVYSYRLPADVIFVRRLVSALGRAWDRDPPQFRTALDVTGSLLFANQASTTAAPVVVEYTARIEAAVLRSDALFQDALAWRLAWTLAPSLALIVPPASHVSGGQGHGEAMGRGPDDQQVRRDQPSTGVQLRQKAAAAAREAYYFAIAKATTAAAREAQPDLEPGDSDWIAGR